AAVGVLPGLVDEPAAQEHAEDEREQDDHQRAADELAERELPAEDQRHQDAQLDHQVGRGELERHRGGEVGSLAEEGARERDGGESSGNSRRISPFATTACTAPERAKPRISAQRISQNIPNANERASTSALPTASPTITSSYGSSDRAPTPASASS